MPTATAKDAKKSAIPRRITNRINWAFESQMSYASAGKTDDEVKKANKKIAKDQAEVLTFIEDLIAKSAG